MLSLKDVIPRLGQRGIEVPSWAYGNSGIRLKVFPPNGTTRHACEVVRNSGYPNIEVALMLDQCNNIENHIAGQIRTVVRPGLAEWRVSKRLPADPMAGFWASGYQEKIEAECIGGTQASWT